MLTHMSINKMTQDVMLKDTTATMTEVDGDLMLAAAPLLLPMPVRAVAPSILADQ
jgi:hypothetical protein